MPVKKRLLLVGWDSADWKLINPLLKAGKLPGVRYLLQGGIQGNLTTLEPQLSPMLWTSIATGKMAYHHGVPGFTEVDPATQQIVPVSAATRKCKTVWEILADNELKSHVVGWFATQGERDHKGCVVSNLFPHLRGVKEDQDPSEWPPPAPGTFWPEELAAELADFRVAPHEIPGDSVLRLFIPNAPEIDQDKDKRMHRLRAHLAEAYSVQAAATYLMEKQPDWDFMAVYFRALDEIKHIFMPYHPPQMAGLPDADFEMYKGVVNATYEAHDMMLQRLIQLAGPDTAIVLISDHGFHSDHLRPRFTPRVPAGITVWHRPQGVLAARGPGLRQNESIYGARLLDITPTVLHYFDLPVGEDMEGRVLRDAFTDNAKPRSVPTWESGQKKERGTMTQEESEELLEQFVALGYIDKPDQDASKAAESTERENKWNLARACLYGGEEEQALALLEECHAAIPERSDYAHMLARCQSHLGLYDEAEATLEGLLDKFGKKEKAHLLRARIATERKDHHKALEHLQAVEAELPEDNEVLLPLARTWLALRNWEQAEATAKKVIERDPENAAARFILARIYLHQNTEAATQTAQEYALEGIGYQFGNARGHFQLGVSLFRQEKFEEAVTALANSLRLDRTLAPAYRYLALAFRALDREEEAVQCDIERQVHRQQASEGKAKRLQRLRKESAERAAERARIEASKPKKDESDEKAAEDVPAMDFVLVSGLPRSGTSLMMQMLEAGGMKIMTDQQRQADDDNPKGYYEWEEIRQLPRNPRLIEKAEGKVVKVISALLPHLPPKHRYKIIFMRRPASEVVRSQHTMITNLGKTVKTDAEHLEKNQERHVQQLLERFAKSPQIELLEVDYPQLVQAPQDWVERLREFVSPEKLPNVAAMAEVVDPSLYRNRGKTPSTSEPS